MFSICIFSAIEPILLKQRKNIIMIIKEYELLGVRFIKLDAPHQGLSPGSVPLGASFKKRSLTVKPVHGVHRLGRQPSGPCLDPELV